MTTTRFAPSPTGALHIGGARTAIFSWLLARNQGGQFRLRIEDTDRERSLPEHTAAILEALEWLGLDWDGETVYQVQREERHKAVVQQLLDTGKAYWCECSPEEVDAMREAARAAGKKPKYDGRCRCKNLGPGPNRVVRFRVDDGPRVLVEDMVKGHVSVEREELDDMILLRSDGAPVYNLAVVVDDHDMGVTHILRGDDHLSNTPKQILIYQALGWELPRFGHVPLIHGADGKKLSKRHGARAVLEYREEGFLPEALINYLVRLGWASGDQEIFTREELIAQFTTDNLSPSAARFDPEKLLWLSGHYIKEASVERLAGLLPQYFEAQGLPVPGPAAMADIVRLFQPRARTLVELAQAAAFLVVADADLAFDEAAKKKCLSPPPAALFEGLLPRLEACEPFSAEALETLLKDYVAEAGVKFKELGPPLRVALTGGTNSPDLSHTMAALGKVRCLSRIRRVLA
ncbi:glutamate--tRNA ligase [Megalodesulfovibrio paquesii]